MKYISLHLEPVRKMMSGGIPGVNQLCTLAVLFLLLKQGMGHIMCSVCDTTAGDKFCVDSPRPPINCTTCLLEDESGTCLEYPEPILESCMIVRTYDDSFNKTLLGVVRTCSGMHIRGETCSYGKDFDRGGIEVYICHTSCESDGCNSAQSLVPGFWHSFLLFLPTTCLLLMMLVQQPLGNKI